MQPGGGGLPGWPQWVIELHLQEIWLQGAFNMCLSTQIHDMKSFPEA